MALSLAARRLTEAHRIAQADLGAVTVEQLRAVWPALDLTNLDGTFDQWLSLAGPIVRAQRTASARLAANYVTVFRKLELPGVRPIVPTLAETVSQEQLATSLRVTGPVSLKANIGRGMLLDAAARIAEDGSAAAGTRIALNGGRETLMETVKADPRAVRWQRVASDNPCPFCLMLVDRGAVYKEDTVNFEAHDHCSCTAEPGYD